MTEFALRIVLLFFPGIVCALLVENREEAERLT